jgi:hypothetical protein
MQRSAPFTFLAAVYFLLSGGVVAAQQTPYVAGSTVTGHVFCGDTDAPARFAKVLLKSTEPSHAGADFMKMIQDNMQKTVQKASASSGDAAAVKPPNEDQKRAMAAAAKGMDQATDMLNSSTVGLDGAYSFSGIKPGTYYVHAIFAGYIDPFGQFSDEDFASTDPAIRARIAQIPTVTVTGTDSVRVDLRLERGAAVSGRILFDDGSPAAGWTLAVMKPGAPESPSDAASALMAQALALSGAAQISKTDDLGRYRISGLTGGDYIVRATLIAAPIGISASNIGDGGSGINLAVYSGDTFSRADAKPISLTMGEEYTGADITVPAHALHNIVGHVYAKSDGHTLNVGSVTLTAKSNAALHMTAAIRDDGSFHFEYLPGGVTYTLTVEGAADGKNSGSASSFMGMNLPNTEVLRKYGSDTLDVMLGDSDLDTVRLTVGQTDWKPAAKKPGAPDVNPGDLLNGIFSGGGSNTP